MTSARETILGKVRKAVDTAGIDRTQRRVAVDRRLAEPPRHSVPARALGKNRAELTALLRHYLTGQSASVLDATDSDRVPQAIAAYLGSAATIRLGTDPTLHAMPWSSVPSLGITQGKASAGDAVGLSRAAAGIAETGTLMLLSGPENPVTLGFLPGTHIVVLDVADIVGTYEEALTVLRRQTGGGGLPRTVNLISGPSRTADIIGILVTGAHGPRRLAVVLVGAAG